MPAAAYLTERRAVRLPTRRGALGRLRRVDLFLLEIVALVLVAGLIAGLHSAAVAAAGVVALAAVVVPVRGRSALRWLPHAASHAARRVRRGTRFVAADARAVVGQPVPESAALPPQLRGLELHDVVGTDLAVVHDVPAGRWCAVGVVDHATPSTDGDGWRQVLRTLPDAAATRVQWVRRARRTRSGEREETFLVVAVRPDLAARAVSRAGGGETGAARVCAEELRRVAGLLQADGLRLVALRRPELIDALARSFSPGRLPPPAGAELVAAGPTASEERWSSYRSDEAWHATYWVAGWPADLDGALAALHTVASTVSLTVGPSQDATYLTTCLVGVSAESRGRLLEASRQLERRAAMAGVSLVRLYGQQEQAFAATLPLARAGGGA